MNLIIVEDETILRDNLAFNIPWEQIGVEVIGVAASGEEAMEMFDRKKPNLVLLDIQMPGISGLELAEWIRGKDTLVRIIVLSGHDTFEYAQRSLELDISKYLLKPAGEQEIMQAVKDTAEALRTELDQLHSKMMLEHRWSSHLPFLREMFLQNWLLGTYSTWEIEKRSEDVLLDIRDLRLFCVAVVDMDPVSEEETRFSSRDASLLQFSMKCVAKECLSAYADWIITMPNGCMAVIFTDTLKEGQLTKEDWEASQNTFLQEVNASVGNLLTIIHQCLKLTASAGISSCLSKPEELPKLYEQARQALQKRILYGHNIAVTYLDRFEPSKVSFAHPELERELEIALETGNKSRAIAALYQLWDEVMEDLHDVDQMYEGVLYFVTLFVRIIQQHGCSVKEVVGKDVEYLQNVQTFSTKQQVKECLERMADKVAYYFDSSRNASGHQVVKTVLNIIEESIHDELTLHSVADKLFINSSYLSRLFKQETGRPFSAYVLERKMERAKLILLEGAKVYDASSAVGYRDVSYFTKVFRKYWGMTPGEVAKS